jgi:hypothetical protein
MAHMRRTGVPHSRQVVALRWTGLLHRGQIRKPDSNLTVDAGSAPGLKGSFGGSVLVPPATVTTPVVRAGSLSGRFESAACCRSHFARRARSAASSSSVRASASCNRLFAAVVVFESRRSGLGTGTTRPQSRHLPATGRSAAGTFSRRPQGQRNLIYPSPNSSGSGGAARRSRIRAPHLGQSMRSGLSGGTLSSSPHRQVIRDMRIACDSSTQGWELVTPGGRCDRYRVLFSKSRSRIPFL